MPHYEFEDEKGERVEMFLTMREAPSIGEWATFGGRRLRRLVSVPVAPMVADYTCTTRVNGFWDKSYPRFDEMGRGVILSKREHENFKAANPDKVWE